MSYESYKSYEPTSTRRQAANVALTVLSTLLLSVAGMAGLPRLLFGPDLQMLGALLLGVLGQTATTGLMALYVATRSRIPAWLYAVAAVFHLVAIVATLSG